MCLEVSYLYNISNELVFKEKIEMKNGLIYGRFLPRYATQPQLLALNCK